MYQSMCGYSARISYCASSAPNYSSNSEGSVQYSPLEVAVHSPQPTEFINNFQPSMPGMYSANKNYETVLHHSQQYYFSPNPFLNPNRKRQRFIGKDEDIESLINEAFEKTTNTQLPDDIDIVICSEKEFKEKLDIDNPGVRGVTLNRRHMGQITQVFVKEDELDKVMLTIGHELGHAITLPINNEIQEEAKAFAFQIAWMQNVHEHDIGNLKFSINLDFNPATNGVHNVAFNQVAHLVSNGDSPLIIFNKIINNEVQIE